MLGHVLGRHVLLAGLSLVGLLLLLLLVILVPGVPELARQQAGVRLELRRVVRAGVSWCKERGELVEGGGEW